MNPETLKQMKEAADGFREARHRFRNGKIERNEYRAARVRFEEGTDLDNVSALIAEYERLKQFCDEFVFEESGGSEERTEALRTFHGKGQYE